MITLYNTQTKQKEEFKPLREGKVSMYVCGPTVYNYIHIGNARTFMSFDTIRRYLIWRGFEVKFVQNITDVDDKIIKRAKEEGKNPFELAQFYTQAFIEDMRAVGVEDPTVRPFATQEIPQMIKLIEALIAKGHAYETEGDVYFAVRSFESYGKLSGRNVDDAQTGHRELRSAGMGLEDRKFDELDFALWKAAKPGEPAWESPWGEGRPGWHIECSAMSEKYLGLPFDIHGGGADLVFPHHENEIAQSEAACACCFAHYWMHGGMLQVNSEKMSKSLGNFLLLRDILKTTSPATLRMLMLQTHYRSPLDFSAERLSEAGAALGRIEQALQNARWRLEATDAEQAPEADADPGGVSFASIEKALLDEFVSAMDDDFNTAGALGALFSAVTSLNSLLAKRPSLNAEERAGLAGLTARLEELMGVLGVTLVPQEKALPEELMVLAKNLLGEECVNAHEAAEKLLQARSEARAQKNWDLADALRDAFTDLNLTVEDTAQGPRLIV